MERGLAISTLQQGQHLGHLEEASWPAMDETQRDSPLNIGLLMQEMDVNVAKAFNVNGCLELRERVIQALLVGTPIELVLPMIVEPLDILLRRTVIPAGVFKFSWPLVVLELLLQAIQLGLGHIDLVWAYFRHDDVDLRCSAGSQSCFAGVSKQCLQTLTRSRMKQFRLLAQGSSHPYVFSSHQPRRTFRLPTARGSCGDAVRESVDLTRASYSFC